MTFNQYHYQEQLVRESRDNDILESAANKETDLYNLGMNDASNGTINDELKDTHAYVAGINDYVSSQASDLDYF